MGSKLLSSAPFRQVYLNSFSCCVSQGRSVSKQAKILTWVSLLSWEGFDYTTSWIFCIKVCSISLRHEGRASSLLSDEAEFGFWSSGTRQALTLLQCCIQCLTLRLTREKYLGLQTRRCSIKPMPLSFLTSCDSAELISNFPEKWVFRYN